MKIEIKSIYDQSSKMWNYNLYINDEFIDNLKGTSDLKNKVNNLLEAWFL